MSNRIIIIGNGFDKEHGLNTGFDSYFDWFIKHWIPNNDPNWKDSFGSILLNHLFNENYPQLDREFVDGKLISDDKHFMNATIKSNAEWLRIQQILGEKRWYDLESYIGDYGKRIIDKNVEIASIQRLYYQLFGRHDSLKKWIVSIYNDQEISNIKAHKKLYANLFSHDDQFISFNYTTTLEDVYGIKREQISYVHGCFRSQDALLFGGSSGFLETSISQQNLDKVKFIQRIYGKKNNYEMINCILRNNRKPSVFILGCNLELPEYASKNTADYELELKNKIDFFIASKGDGVLFADYMLLRDKCNGLWINYFDTNDMNKKRNFFKTFWNTDEVENHVLNNDEIKQKIKDEPGGR